MYIVTQRIIMPSETDSLNTYLPISCKLIASNDPPSDDERLDIDTAIQNAQRRLSIIVSLIRRMYRETGTHLLFSKPQKVMACNPLLHQGAPCPPKSWSL